MSYSILYLRDSGHIVQTLSVTDPQLLKLYVNDTIDALTMEGDPIDMTRCYIDNGIVLPRQPVGLDTDTYIVEPGTKLIIQGIPADCWYANNSTGKVMLSKKTISMTANDVGVVSFDFLGKYHGSVTITTVDLSSTKVAAKQQIDTLAELARSALLTPGVNQAVTYMRKAEAARLYLAGATLTEPQLSRLTNEADTTGMSIPDSAQAIVEAADKWEAADAAIDAKRIKAKTDVNQATTSKEIEDILSALVF